MKHALLSPEAQDHLTPEEVVKCLGDCFQKNWDDQKGNVFQFTTRYIVRGEIIQLHAVDEEDYIYIDLTNDY